MRRPAGGMRNMTEGSCWRHLLLFALPMFAGSLLQQLYNLVDSWVVGKYVGDSALAAVGVGFSVIFLFTSLFIGMATGSTVVISQFYGAGKMQRVRDAVDTTYTAMLVTAVPLTVAAVLAVPLLLQVLQVEADALADARTYLVIVCAGLLGAVGYNTNAGILQGLGNSRTSLLFLAVSAILNIVLDLATVLLWGMGVAGVAYATVFSQLVSWLFGIFYINRIYPEIRIHPLSFRFDKSLFLQITKIGLPAGLQMATVALGIMAIMSKVNSFGLDYTAGYNVGHKLDNIGFLPVQAISNAATAFIGQNMGAEKPARVKRGATAAVTLAVGWSFGIMALMLPARRFLVGCFTDNPAIVAAGAQYLWCILLFYPLFAVMFCLNNIMRGAGESVMPLIFSLIAQIGIRVPLVYLLANRFGADYMYYGFGLGWLIADFFVVPYFLTGHWKRRGSMARRDAPGEADGA